MNSPTTQIESSFGKILYDRLFKNKEGLIAFVILADLYTDHSTHVP